MLHLIFKAFKEQNEEKSDFYIKMIEKRLDRATPKIITGCALILFIYVVNYLIG